ncbi:hypothetical protein [Paraburkholderia antibiotica]|uniref:Uncharacterized protein n=1 Tax=Paraburkholderia antibiotica TaxID=2728839 RepID=A0A7X9X2W9_9BURK|nr:hypothetical protein [Paraburkholderia antibiotica]NML30416.1 hypothetical protein [Paraburkholderia antibiotica]
MDDERQLTGESKSSNPLSQSPLDLILQGIANGLSAVFGMPGEPPTTSTGGVLVNEAGQAAKAVPGTAWYGAGNTTLNSGGNDSASEGSGGGSAYDRVYGGRTSVENVTSRGTSIETVPNSNDATVAGDFASLNPNNVKIVSTGRGDVSIGTLNDGTTVILRPSKDGRTTIEFQNANGRTTKEIRYGSK